MNWNGRHAATAFNAETATVNVKVPALIGVPVSVPAGDNVKPGGNAPAFTDQVYSALPPVAVRRCEYEPRVAALSEEELGGMDSKGPDEEAAVASRLKAPRPFVKAAKLWNRRSAT